MLERLEGTDRPAELLAGFGIFDGRFHQFCNGADGIGGQGGDDVIDVLITDVIMPGKDGPTWVREALIDRPDTQVVFVSGYAEDTFAEQQAEIPNSVFLPKPFSLTDLAATVQTRIAC